MFSRASGRRCGLSAVLISVFLHSLGQMQTHASQQIASLNPRHNHRMRAFDFFVLSVRRH